MTTMQNLNILSLAIQLTLHLAQSLHLVRLHIDSPAENGSDVRFHCDFRLKNTGFTVKFYKNHLEFYRWEQFEMSISNQKYYPLIGVHVDLKKSNASDLLLKHVEPNTEGTYACEINTEQPYFMSAKVQQDLRVYVLPKEPLRLLDTSKSTNDKELLSLTCVSAPTKPPTILTWFLNDRQLTETNSNHTSNVTTEFRLQESDGLIITHSHLQIRPNAAELYQQTNRFFWPIGRIVREQIISCRSVLSQISGQTFQQLRVHETGQQRNVIKSESDDSGCESSEQNSINQRINFECKSPLNISIHEAANFVVGQSVLVSCQTPSTYPPPFLQWFVNERLIAHTPLTSKTTTNREDLVRSNEYLFSKLIQNRAQMHSPVSIASKSDTTKQQEDPLNPNFQDSKSNPTIYHHFAKSQPQAQRLNVRFILVKRHFQTVDATMTLRCVATFAKRIHFDQISIQLINDRNSISYKYAHLHSNSKATKVWLTWKSVLLTIAFIYAL